MEKFHELYSALLLLEPQIGARAIGPAEARDELERLIARQQAEAERDSGTYGVEVFRRAKYAMAAMVDEHFLRPDGPARDAWMGHLLESKLFQSERAGEKLFREIDSLQLDRTPASADLARIYLAVLGLGFQGRLRGRPGSEEQLAEYRTKLNRIVGSRDRDAHDPFDEKIVPRAYASTVDDSVGSELPYLRPWVWALVAVFTLWLVVGHVLWISSKGQLEKVVSDIRNGTSSVFRGGGR